MNFVRNVALTIFLISLSPIVCAGGDKKDEKINNDHKPEIAAFSDQEAKQLFETLVGIMVIDQRLVDAAVQGIIDTRNKPQ